MILLLKLSLAAGAVMAVILLVYEILLSIDFVKGCWRRHIKRSAQRAVPGTGKLLEIHIRAPVRALHRQQETKETDHQERKERKTVMARELSPLTCRMALGYMAAGKGDKEIQKLTGVSLPTIENMRQHPGRYENTAKKEGDYTSELYEAWNSAVNPIRQYLGKPPIERI